MKKIILIITLFIFLLGCEEIKYQTIIKKDGVEILNITTDYSVSIENRYDTIIISLFAKGIIAIIEKPFQNCVYEIETNTIQSLERKER